MLTCDSRKILSKWTRCDKISLTQCKTCERVQKQCCNRCIVLLDDEWKSLKCARVTLAQCIMSSRIKKECCRKCKWLISLDKTCRDRYQGCAYVKSQCSNPLTRNFTACTKICRKYNNACCNTCCNLALFGPKNAKKCKTLSRWYLFSVALSRWFLFSVAFLYILYFREPMSKLQVMIVFIIKYCIYVGNQKQMKPTMHCFID